MNLLRIVSNGSGRDEALKRRNGGVREVVADEESTLKHSQRKAAKARAIAAFTNEPKVRKALLEAADMWDRIVDAEERRLLSDTIRST